MAVKPTTQQTTSPVVASPDAPEGKFSQNILPIARVVSTVTSTVAALTEGFPSPSLQSNEPTTWRREIVTLYHGYAALLRQIETFLAPSATDTPGQDSGDRQQAAGVLKQTLQEKEREILRKLAEKRTFIPREDYRSYTSALSDEVQQLRARLDQA